MSNSTPSTQVLKKAKVAFSLKQYDYDPGADRIGLQAADAMGADPEVVYKTLMIEMDGKPVCAVIPSDREVNMKKLAKALGGKSAAMMQPHDAERVTGFKVGGISPLGQRKRVPCALEEAAMERETIHVNGGQRGLQILVAPKDLVSVLRCVVADITR
ncbi:MAG: Cys-tRNA(Pro) deacylase [Nannocystaceae bacterium]